MKNFRLIKFILRVTMGDKSPRGRRHRGWFDYITVWCGINLHQLVVVVVVVVVEMNII